MSFDLDLFIRESNRIDPQPNYSGTEIIPGEKPGDLMYDNHIMAWERCLGLRHLKFLHPKDLLAIHKELTKGVDFFERRNASGKFRRYDVLIGGEFCPSPSTVHILIENVLIPRINANCDPWEAHDLFECIHPFIDGNGRTGRLLFNLARMAMGLEPVVIYYSDRYKYYAHIQEFRETRFPQILKELSKEVFAV